MTATADARPQDELAEYSDVDYVFEPHSATTPDVGEYLRALWERRTFLVALAEADLRAQRSRAALGRIWAVIDPLFQGGIYFFLYVVMRGASGKQLEFLPVLIAGMFLFGLSTSALNEGGNSISRSKHLMLNSTFPRALLPVTSVYRSLRAFVPAACVLVVLFPVVGGRLGSGLFVLPLLFGIQTVASVGVALLVSTFTVLVPDGKNVVSYVNRILFFTTPVIYPASLLPDDIRSLIGWQPLFALFASYQDVFSGRVPDAGLVVQAALWAVALLVVGGRVFLRHERQFSLHL